jgi:hypothetical protein
MADGTRRKKNPFSDKIPLLDALRSYGPRYRYRDKTVMPSGSPRSNTPGGHSQARAGYECGQTECWPTKLVQVSSKSHFRPTQFVTHVPIRHRSPKEFL